MTHDATWVGDVKVSVVCEGYAPLELDDELPGVRVDWAEERRAYPWAFHDDATWAWHVHAFALRTPHGVVLVDTGLGDFPPFRPWATSTPRARALAAAGVDADDVVAVAHTHLHADHAGGATIGGRPSFPNARHHVHPDDWSWFADRDEREAYTARGAMDELERRGMLDLRADDHDVVPGVRVVHAPGHTPGHRVVVLDAGDETLVLAGDLLHTPPHVRMPEVPSNHDVDAALACDSRIRVLREAREAGRRVAVSHFGHPFGSVGAGGWSPE